MRIESNPSLPWDERTSHFDVNFRLNCCESFESLRHKIFVDVSIFSFLNVVYRSPYVNIRLGSSDIISNTVNKLFESSLKKHNIALISSTSLSYFFSSYNLHYAVFPLYDIKLDKKIIRLNLYFPSFDDISRHRTQPLLFASSVKT